MPYFVNIGAFPGNKCGVGSRGYQLFRRGRRITARWGAVMVTARKQFCWCHTPQEKVWSFRSEKRAAEEVKVLAEARVSEDGYSRLPRGVKIRLR